MAVIRKSESFRNYIGTATRSVAALMLCCLLPGQIIALPAPAVNGSGPGSKSSGPAEKSTPDERVFHLLNRFAFGPTPADVAAVRQIGVDRWFEEQLHPAAIPEPELDARLAEFPAMQLPVDALLMRFPSGAEIRQAANGKQQIPDNPWLKAIYQRHVDLYLAKQADKQDKQDKQAKQDGSGPGQGQQNMAAMQGSAMSNVAGPAGNSGAAGNGVPAQAPNLALDKVQDRPDYGDTLLKSVLALPPDGRVARLMAMRTEEYAALQASAKGPQRRLITQDMSPSQRELLADYNNPTQAVVEEMQAQHLIRAIDSPRQLQEVMTDFWLNHFNVYLRKNEEAPYNLVSYERDVIRPNALGKFEDLLVATAESPAMQQYLDNASSTGPDSVVAEKQAQRIAAGRGNKTIPPGLNENYGRELMELHTLGVNGGYTQKDVTEVAKVFTGWTVDKPQLGGGFKFDESRHEPGTKMVLGHKINEDGQKEGLEVLHILATSPATAHFISNELAVAFVSDNPPRALVERMAQTFLHTHGDIPSILRTMLHSSEFWSAENEQAKVKTPFEYVVSAVRASQADVSDTRPLVNALNQMGMPLYGCVPPTGYSDKADVWVSTGALVTRMNFGLSLASNKFAGIGTDWGSEQTATSYIGDAAGVSEIDAKERRLERELIPTGISEHTRAAILDQAGATPNVAQAQPGQLQVSQIQSSPAQTGIKDRPAGLQIAPGSGARSQAGGQRGRADQLSSVDKQDAMLAGLLLGSPEFQRR